MKIYTYKGCSTCKKATKWLTAQGIDFEELPIRETPPTKAELKRMLGYVGDKKKLFNTSGQDYRAQGLKDQMADMTEAEAFDLLRGNGNLVKRPFVLTDEAGTVGFKEAVWEELFSAP